MGAATKVQLRDEPLDLAAVLGLLWAHRRIIGGISLVVASVFAMFACLMTPVYRASAVLAPVPTTGDGGLDGALQSISTLAAVTGVNFGSAAIDQTEEALAVLRSREFTQAFILELGLMSVLFADQWDTKANVWRVPPSKQPSLAKAYKRFTEMRVVSHNKLTGLITVAIEWRDPTQAAAWTNELVARLNEVMRSRAIVRADGYLTYLREELSGATSVEARAALTRLMEAQINQRMRASVSRDYAMRIVEKALAPDIDDPVRPKRALLIVLGIVTGFVVGIVGVVLSMAIRNPYYARPTEVLMTDARR